MASAEHVSHGRDDIAYHLAWGFRTKALVWEDSQPIGLNFHPVATEFYGWLLRKGQFTVFTEEHRGQPNSYTNPYTYSCATLASITADVFNDSYAIGTSVDAIAALDAEIQRVRIFSEKILYVARMCESLIKQLLYCTQIPKRYYEKASLGKLLSTECRGCRASGNQRHKLSLLGSLAHRYRLCHDFEGCLVEHLKIVGHRRNIEAAHSQVTNLNVRSAAESRAQLMQDSETLGNEFVHMLRHIRDLEARMDKELQAAVMSNRIEQLGGSEPIAGGE